MDRPKMGFGVPIIDWFREELSVYFDEYFSPSFLDKQGIFKTEVLISMKESYLAGSTHLITKLWTILVFQMWYKRWMT